MASSIASSKHKDTDSWDTNSLDEDYLLLERRKRKERMKKKNSSMRDESSNQMQSSKLLKDKKVKKKKKNATIAEDLNQEFEPVTTSDDNTNDNDDDGDERKDDKGEKHHHHSHEQQHDEQEEDENEDHIWTGFETHAMKEVRCSLLLAVEAYYRPRIKSLPPQKALLIHKDSAVHETEGLPGCSNYWKSFKGCTLLQLEPTAGSPHRTMPTTLTVLGKCNFTADNFKRFRVLYRNHRQSRALQIPPNSKHEWPDVRAFLCCPMCGVLARIPEEKGRFTDEYWLTVFPIVQMVVQHKRDDSDDSNDEGDGEDDHDMTIALRLVCRLTCLECMSDILEGMQIHVQQPDETGGGGGKKARRGSMMAFSLSALELLEEAGSASFLQDDPPRPKHAPHIDDPLDAWTLYNIWEQSGSWEALQMDYRMLLGRSLQCNTTTTTTATPSHHKHIRTSGMLDDKTKAKNRYGRKCGSQSCDRVHGKKDPATGKIVRLTVFCETCESVYYCSKHCRRMSREAHQRTCEVLQREQREKRKIKKVQCDTCQRVLPYTMMKKCGRCRRATYCTVACQKKDWGRHKVSCQIRAAQKAG